MSLNYDPTAYETWRQNYEMREALAWFGGFVFFVMRLDKRLSVLETKVDDLRGEQEEYKTLKDLPEGGKIIMREIDVYLNQHTDCSTN